MLCHKTFKVSSLSHFVFLKRTYLNRDLKFFYSVSIRIFITIPLCKYVLCVSVDSSLTCSKLRGIHLAANFRMVLTVILY